MTRRNIEDIRAALKRDVPTIGGWMQLGDESVAEIMGSANFDWIALDLEHGRIAEERYPSLFRAIENGGSMPFARIGQVTPYAIKAVLDSGARGIILPMIDSSSLLKDAISWAHFPPRGTRGVGYSRANLFGKRFDAYLNSISPFVVAQIEHIKAVDGIDEILAVDGLDAVMIGPYDLSASMGLTGRFDAPEFQTALERVVAACKKAGVVSGVHVVQPQPDKLKSAIDEGHRFIAYGIDAVFLWNSAIVPAIHLD